MDTMGNNFSIFFCRRRGSDDVENIRMTLDDRMPFFLFFSWDEQEGGGGFEMEHNYFVPNADGGDDNNSDDGNSLES